MRPTAEARPPRRPDHAKLAHSGRQGTPVSAAARGPVSAAADTASPLDCPRGWLGCQAMSGPPSARQRARTAAAPCLTSRPPGARRKAPAPLRSARAADSCHPAHPLGGSADRLPLLEVSGCAAPATGPLRSFLPPCKRLECTAAGLLRQDQASRVHQPGPLPRTSRQRRPEGVPDRLRCWRTAVTGPGRAGGQEAHARAGRGAGVGRRTAWWQRAPTPLPAETLDCWSIGLLLAGLCAADRDAVEGFPWPGRPRGWAPLGSRSPGLPLAAAVCRPWKATHGNLRSLLRQGRAPLRSVLRSLDTRSLRLGFAA